MEASTTTMQMVQGGSTFGQTVEAASPSSLNRITKPVVEQSDLDEIEVEDEVTDEEATAEQETEATPMEPVPAPVEASKPAVLDDMMDLLIDEAMRERLHAAIRTTPHAGYRPTLKITERGRSCSNSCPSEVGSVFHRASHGGKAAVCVQGCSCRDSNPVVGMKIQMMGRPHHTSLSPDLKPIHERSAEQAVLIVLRGGLWVRIPPPHAIHAAPNMATMATASRISRSRIQPMASKAAVPYWTTSTISRPKRKPRLAKPATTNGRISIFPMPAAHPITLYGIGVNPAIKTPTVPCRSSRTSNRCRFFSCRNRTRSGRPARAPNQEPTMAPATLVKVATSQMLNKRAPSAPAAIGRISKSAEWGDDGFRERQQRQTEEAASAASMTACSHATPCGWRPHR